MDTQTSRLFIFGSCVSRDTREYLDSTWRINEYVARQGILSAVSGDAGISQAINLKSEFQRRCVRWDIEGAGLELIKKHRKNTDLLLMDLIDERFGYYRIKGTGFITETFELKNSGLIESLPKDDYEFIPFGTDEHFILWAKAFELFFKQIKRMDLSTLMLAPPYAAKANNGGGGFDCNGRKAEEWNLLYSRYYAHVEATGVPVVRPPSRFALADVDHRWGIAAFHYIPKMYEYFSSKIVDFAANKYYQKSIFR